MFNSFNNLDNYPPIRDGFIFLEEHARDTNSSIEEILAHLTTFFSKVGYYRRPYELRWDRLLRARSVSAPSIEEACSQHFDNVQKLSYPKKEHNPRAGRCNPDGHPVFYCSNDNAVTVFEIKPKVGDFVAVTTFKQKLRPKITIQCPVIGVEQIWSNLKILDPSNQMIGILESDKLYFDQNPGSKTKLLDQSIAKWYSEVVDDSNLYLYKLTCAYYEMLVNNFESISGHPIQALVYPSVASEISGYNIVMETQLADNFAVDNAQVFHVKDITNKVYTLELLKVKSYIKRNGDISWKNFSEWPNEWIFGPQTRPAVNYNYKNRFR